MTIKVRHGRRVDLYALYGFRTYVRACVRACLRASSAEVRQWLYQKQKIQNFHGKEDIFQDNTEALIWA